MTAASPGHRLAPPVPVQGSVSAPRTTGGGPPRPNDRLTEAAMEDRKKEGYF